MKSLNEVLWNNDCKVCEVACEQSCYYSSCQGPIHCQCYYSLD